MNTLSNAELAHAVEVVNGEPYEAYPPAAHRLHLGQVSLMAAQNMLVVPEGPWHVSGHPNRQPSKTRRPPLDLEVPEEASITPTEHRALWRSQDLLLDQYGRPIHPYWRQLLGHPDIGMPTGVGFFYKYGSNATIDPVVYRDNGQEILLIRRKKGGKWALPGGFVDRSDSSPEAGARRELGEETGLTDVGGHGEVLLDYCGFGQRDTLHAWTENQVVLLHGDQEYLQEMEPVAGDDAIDVGWFKAEQIDQLNDRRQLFDVHAMYIQMAFDSLRSGGIRS